MIKKCLPPLIKIFLLGLLLQFLLHTFVTFKLGRDASRMTAIWMWKELMVGGAGIGLLRMLHTHNKRSLLRKDKTIRTMKIVLGVSIILSLFLSLVIHQQPISHWLLAFKYDYFGFIIFFIMLHRGSFLDKEHKQKLFDRYGEVIKRCLILSLVRWLIILTKPGTLEVLFGYSRGAVEGIIGLAPPAVYHTNFHEGRTRNQFLFERPIMFGFWLVAFWPLFYLLVLKRVSLQKVRARRILYGLAVFLTISRAARGSRFIITFILLLFTYKKHWKKLVGLTVLGIMGLAGLLFISPKRYSSDTGHLQETLKGIQLFVDKPRIGQGAATAGPGSHQLGDPSRKFNPENQFIQVLDEFGVWGVLWIFLFAWMIFSAYPAAKFIWLGGDHSRKYRSTQAYKEKELMAWVHFAFAVGMVGLGISGLVLHSFVDRMIVYPMMVLYGLGMRRGKP